MRSIIVFSILSVGQWLLGQSDTVIQVDSFKSQIIEEVVGYKICLPESYDNYESSKNYPTIYVLDTGDMFDITRTYIEFLAKTGKVPESIVIGISSSDRIRDFTPTFSMFDYSGKRIEEYRNSGKANDYIELLEEELMVKIRDEYIINGYETLIGHSLSGLLVAHAITNSKAFDGFILIDPSTWWDEQVVNGYTKESYDQVYSNKFVFMASAGNLQYSNEMERMKSSQATFTEKLKQIGLPNERLSFSNYDSETHGTVILRSILDGIEWIYSGYLVPDMKHRTADEIIGNFKSFDNKMGYHFPALEPMVTWLSSVKRSEQNYVEAAVLSLAS